MYNRRQHSFKRKLGCSVPEMAVLKAIEFSFFGKRSKLKHEGKKKMKRRGEEKKKGEAKYIRTMAQPSRDATPSVQCMSVAPLPPPVAVPGADAPVQFNGIDPSTPDNVETVPPRFPRGTSPACHEKVPSVTARPCAVHGSF